AFMGVDAILELYLNIVDGMVVYKKIIEKHIKAELPFMATENILMECVKNGGDRQELHEIIRKHSMLAAEQVKVYGKDNDLIKRIKADEHFAVIKDRIDAILKPKNFIGRAPAQVNEFLASIKPLLKKYSGKLTENSDTIKV
ncbi:adenylosuccinate lyase, partial [bacterium]|nr:adenylosuccinate lyase [bacterium]